MCMHDRISLLNVGTCSLLHLRHLPPTAPRSNVALAAPAEGWRLSWLLLVFQFHIIFRLRAADRFFFSTKAKKKTVKTCQQRPQRARLLHLYGTCCTCLRMHLRHLLPPIAPTAPAAPVSYCTCGTCPILHLRHLPSTAPGSHVALATPAEGWRLSWLLSWFLFSNFISFFCLRAADPFFFQHKGKKENSQHLPTTPSESASSTPRAPAARASYCTYGTCCTCLLLHLRHLLLRLPHLLSTPAATPAFNAYDTCSACFLLEMLNFSYSISIIKRGIPTAISTK